MKEYSSRPLENAKELFNLRHASLRNAIERAFGVLKKRFPIIRSTTEPTYSADIQSEIILACCILHNYLIDEGPNEIVIPNEDSNEDILNKSPTEEVNLPRDEDEDAALGEHIRNKIATDMWNDYVL